MHLTWYVARSSGIVSWALLATSVLWGLALSTKVFGRRPRPNWLLDLHRFLGGAAVIFVGVHVLAVLFDTYTHFGLADVLVPFASYWRPAAMAWGIAGFYLLVAVEITSLLRNRLSKKTWHTIHLLSYPLFLLSTLHFVTAGTDWSNLALRAATGAVVALVALLTAVRVQQDTAPTRKIEVHA